MARNSGGGTALVVVVSDALGETAELVARAAVSQFPGHTVEVRRYPHITTEADFVRVLGRLPRTPEVVVFTVILPELRAAIERHCAAREIPFVDVMGPLVGELAARLGDQPSLQPGLVHRLDAQYFRRVDAVEFAVRFDDGKDPSGIIRADIVLLGVSRTSKTPTSLYLAHRGLKVANVPLVPEADLPDEVFSVPREKVIGLTVNPEVLLHIRSERLRSLGLGPRSSYADLGRIIAELEYADKVFRRVGCRVVDVSQRAVEETAGTILEMVGGA